MSSLISLVTKGLSHIDILILYALAGVVLLALLWHLSLYLRDPYSHRANHIPGPAVTQLSDFWLGWVAAKGHRSENVHRLHQKYGKIVRIAPNHVSIADPDAIQIIYAHGNGALKADFYDAFVSIRRGLFNTRDRAEHTRKRKIVSHIFSQKNVLEFEPYIHAALSKLLQKWDRLCDADDVGMETHRCRPNEGGRAWFDCLPWYNFLAFDIIGDLAFGQPFGMLDAEADSAEVAAGGQDAIKDFGEKKIEVIHVPAVKILNDRGDYSASMGVLPVWFRPYAKRIPWYARGNQAVQNLAGIAIAAVDKRLQSPTDRVDLLTRLQQGKDEEGNPMGKEELTAEALTQLIAGSDTTSNSSCAITYWLARTPLAQSALQKELDDALGTPSESDSLPTYDQVKRLPYLEACVNEGLRIHSTSSIGLPRIVPEGGLEIAGVRFPEGAVVSVPSYTVHRDTQIWGEDVEVYRPERWFEQDASDIQKTFNPFSFGPRACVGKNLATMELLLIIATIFRHYEFVLMEPEKPLDTREGFLRKPLACYVGMKKRRE